MALPSLEPDLVQTGVAQALLEQGVEADEAAAVAAEARRYYRASSILRVCLSDS
jgi:hypothetical protein